MKENVLELSGEKTSVILFNNGENPNSLRQLELGSNISNYKQTTKFQINKLNWRLHIENVITNARKRLNKTKLVHSPGAKTEKRYFTYLFL